MQKKEFFGALLLVSLVSTIMLTGIVLSTVGPSIFVYPSTGITASSDVYVYVTGSGWNPNAPVTLYWDQQNTNHTIAIMTPSTSGTFRLDQLEIERVPIGVHKIIAVQGVNTATCTYTVTATLPPDETLLDPIQQVENNVGNIQANFTTIISGLGDIEKKLDNTTSGLPGIQTNLTNINNNVNAVEGKLDPLGNTTQMSSRNGDYDSYTGYYGQIFESNASETVEYTVTFSALINESNAYVSLWTMTGRQYDKWFPYTIVHCSSIHYDLLTTHGYLMSATFTIAAKGISFGWQDDVAFQNNQGVSLSMRWDVTVQAPPGVAITYNY